MKIELNKLYNYIYGDWADIEKHIKPDLPDNIKEKIRIEKKAKIVEFFKTNFPQTFFIRETIRAAKNSELEILLFGNDKDVTTGTPFPVEEKQMDSGFGKHEQHFNLLTTHGNGTLTLAARKQFRIYFKICKLIADRFEFNNNSLNDTAYTNAYAMLILFGINLENPFNVVEKYLDKHNYFNVSKHPIHDALYFNLPQLDNKIQLDEWRKLIHKYGPKILTLFTMAPDIEKQLGRCPVDLNEARVAASNVRYTNAKVNPALASLFLEFNIKESFFDYALVTERKRKKKDNLPNIMLAGANVKAEYANYHLVKLPIDDLNAYILGHLTNCCQSINGNSNQCVIDGITRENNGFYVLLKSKEAVAKDKESKSDNKPLVDGKINYEKFAIVGQGYAWITKDKGGLVIDSWENKNPEHDDKVIVDLLYKLAQLITEEQNSAFLQVLIGTGGKTPTELTHLVMATPGTMLEGTQYPDSVNQSMIHFNSTRYSALRDALVMRLKQFLNPAENIHDRYLFNWIQVACVTVNDFTKTMSLPLEDIINKIKKTPIHSRYRVTPWQETYYMPENLPTWEMIMNLAGRNILSEPFLAGLFAVINAYYTNKDVVERIYYNPLIKVSEAGFEIDALIVNKILHKYDPEVTQDIIKSLTFLRKINLENDTDIRKVFFNSQHYHAGYCMKAYTILQEAKLENNKDILKKVFSAYDNVLVTANSIVRAIHALREEKLENNLEVRQLMLASEFPDTCVTAILDLMMLGLYQDVALRTQVLSYRDPSTAMIAIYELGKANLLHDNKIREFVFAKNQRPIESAQNIISAMCLLREAKLENNELAKELLLESHYYRYSIMDIFRSISYLRDAGIELTRDIKTAFANNFHNNRMQFAKLLVDAYGRFKREEFELTDHIRYHLINSYNPVHSAYEYIQRLNILRKANLEHYADIKDKVTLLSKSSLDDTLTAMKLLREAKLLDNDSIRSELLDLINDKSYIPDYPVAAARAIIKLQKVNLENIPEIRNAVINDSDYKPEAHAKIYCNFISKSKFNAKEAKATAGYTSKEVFFERFCAFVTNFETTHQQYTITKPRLGFFPSKHSSIVTECLDRLHRVRKYFDIYSKLEDAENELLNILVRLNSSLVANKSRRCLNNLKQFLKKQQVFIPDELCFARTHFGLETMKDSALFNLTLQVLHKAFNSAVSAKPQDAKDKAESLSLVR